MASFGRSTVRKLSVGFSPAAPTLELVTPKLFVAPAGVAGNGGKTGGFVDDPLVNPSFSLGGEFRFLHNRFEGVL